ncbi:5-methylthioadenosine/S-adenosylhomocysteine deaminase [Acrasis kona]|uniref:5-methylthioadenosine/S-adenosylhomocysteine deaminase n=1 Tax=Acrasis kona TaxID=1008807 RepID=A0AAW2Z2P9_9EUKA
MSKYVLLGICLALSVVAPLIIFRGAEKNFDTTLGGSPRAIRCKQPPIFSPKKYDINPDRPPIKYSKQTLIKNGRTVLNGSIVERFSVLIGTNGKIVNVGQDVKESDAYEIIDAEGKYIMPGTVDCHSHLGVHGKPGLSGNTDVNEITNPVLPQMRAIDALDSEDFAIDHILRSGVTTSLVLPGSSNTMGGEGVIVKNKIGTSNSDMLFPGAPMALKMACGENPKHYYNRGKAPSSRMGSAWFMREKLQQAKDLIKKQDDFDCGITSKSVLHRPENLELNGLSYLLRNHPNITLHVHCYQTHDFEMIVRLSKEFNFKIDTFQHAIEAHKVPDLFLKNNISAAIFADRFGFKTEAYEASVDTPVILERAGVNVILKSDHPVTHSKWLLMSAGKAYYFGMSLQGSLDAITINPAKALKLGHRVGALRAGYDADVVIYDRHPLQLGARADKVFVDGALLVDNKIPLHSNPNKIESTSRPDHIVVEQSIGGECTTRTRYSSYAIKDALLYTMDGTEDASRGNVVVLNGNVSCVGSSCVIPSDAVVFSVTNQNGILTPGMIESTTDIGLKDISSEVTTNDGTSTTPFNEDLRARDAVRMESRTMRAAFKSGVTTVISRRQGNALVNGWSVAFHTNGKMISDSVIKEQVALHVNIGLLIKSTSKQQFNSVSEQVSKLRGFFNKMSDIPLIVAKCHQADDLDQLLSLQKEFGFKLIVTGGAEAHLISDMITKNVSVIVTPIAEGEQWLEDWDMRRSSDDFGSSVLYKNGVSLGVGIGSAAASTRNLRWAAGLLSTDGFGVLPPSFALKSITSQISDMFSLPDGVGRIKVGTRANFVLFDGNPITFEGRPKLVAVGDMLECGDQLKQF